MFCDIRLKYERLRYEIHHTFRAHNQRIGPCKGLLSLLAPRCTTLDCILFIIVIYFLGVYLSEVWTENVNARVAPRVISFIRGPRGRQYALFFGADLYVVCCCGRLLPRWQCSCCSCCTSSLAVEVVQAYCMTRMCHRHLERAEKEQNVWLADARLV